MASEYGKQKVVYQFNSDDEIVHAAGLKNLKNHLNTVGDENLTAIALIHGQAWTMVARQTGLPVNLETIKELKARGVEFCICKQTLADNGLTPDDLAVELDLITGGVAELTKLQMNGFIYIKP